MNTSTGLIHSRTRRKIKLITDPDEIFKITKHRSDNPTPRCGRCKKVTTVLKSDFGNTQKPRYRRAARICWPCFVIFPDRGIIVSEFGEVIVEVVT